MNSPLADNPTLRKRIYAAFWTLGVALGALQVGFASVDGGTPDWMKVALAVYAFLGGAVGFTASQNTPAEPDYDVEDVDLYADDEPLDGA